MTGRRRTLAVLVAALTVPGCVYYNAMWSAERFAKRARQAEARGEEGMARSLWMQAATKAESVHVRHPRSKWADDALVLQAEALARGGQCPLAVGVIDTARIVATERIHQDRVALAAARCTIERGRPDAVPALIEPALSSSDRALRSRAQFLAAAAAAARGDAPAAVAHYRASAEREAGPALVRLLLVLDQDDEALALLPTLAGGRFDEASWTGLLGDAAAAAGAQRVSPVLDQVLAGMRVPEAPRGRLLLADGDRLYAAGAYAAAADRYDQVASGLPDQPETLRGAVRALKARTALATTKQDLAGALAALEAAGNRPGRAAAAEVDGLAALLQRIAAPDSTEAAELRAAELARDSLHAPALAAGLFRAFALRRPTSLFAPKALVAALALSTAGRDTVLALLERDYAESPYTLALRGEPSPGYGAAEDSLARALGVSLVRTQATYVARLAEPLPGPLGPWEDVVFRGGGFAAFPPADSAADAEDARIRGRQVQPVRPRPAPPGQPRPEVQP